MNDNAAITQTDAERLAPAATIADELDAAIWTAVDGLVGISEALQRAEDLPPGLRSDLARRITEHALNIGRSMRSLADLRANR